MLEPCRITEDFLLEPSTVEFTCCRASGAGGQYVNRTDSAVQLRFDTALLPEMLRLRLKGKVTEQGILLIDEQENRSQLKNKECAYQRLIELLRQASVAPQKRKKTKPTYASKLRRLASKKHHSMIKKQRNSREE